ncbi:MAG: type II toxin-antitoxin system VapC family toxin [Actinomycetota bacterium]
MIVDTSALVAVVVREDGFEAVLDKLSAPPSAPGIGAPTVVELGIILSARLGRDARDLVATLLYELDIAEVPFGEAHWREAVGAFWRYGRGRHPAALNFGDCLSYAVARLADQPLLYVGDDFGATDILAA